MALVDAVLFDLDGTLVDSLADIGGSMNSALESMGLPIHPLSDYRAFVGDGVRLLAERALPADRRDAATLDDSVARMRAIYATRVAAETRPYPGIPDMLDGLARRGLALGILSNKPHALTVEVASRILGRWSFACVFGEREGVPRKPDPASALEAAALLGAPPQRVLYVGDTPTDMATAAAAGMSSVGVTWGFRGEAELVAAGAGRIARVPADVLAAAFAA